MVIELNDHDSRLIYSILLKEAQEHFTYASTSEVAERLYELAARLHDLSPQLPTETAVTS